MSRTLFYFVIMTSTKPLTAPVLLRYWVTPDWEEIRIEWQDAAGITRSASGYKREGCLALGWHYAKPPEALAIAARDCLADGYEYSVPACEFMGTESYGTMDHMVADRCMSCGTVMPSDDWLSREGSCGRCFVVQMKEAV